MDPIEVSVIIPSIGRGEALLNTLRDLSLQVGVSWEVIVVLQGAYSIEIRELMRNDFGARLRLFESVEPNASRARNIGLMKATGLIVIFLDDDVRIPNPNFLLAHASNYRRNKYLSGVRGQILAPGGIDRKKRPLLSRFTSFGWLYFPSNYAFPTSVRSGRSANLSARREYALKVGGMDEQYERGAHREESDFCLRLTERFGMLYFDPSAGLVHLGEETGGIRTWGRSSLEDFAVHFVGEWYFILKNTRMRHIKLYELPHHLGMLVRRQIIGELRRSGLAGVVPATCMSIRSLWAAIKKNREGTKYLELPATSARSRCGQHQ